MIEIERFSTQVTVVAGSAAGTTSARFPFGRYAGGGVLIASTGGATQISWYAASAAADTPVQIYSGGSAVTTAVTVGAHPVPDACFAFPYIAPVIAGGTTCSLVVTLKG